MRAGIIQSLFPAVTRSFFFAGTNSMGGGVSEGVPLVGGGGGGGGGGGASPARV
jgi:hypothetical protein